MAHTTPAKIGRPYDAEARVIALKLRRQIDASPFSIRQLARHAGMTDVDYRATLSALRGERAARHHVERIAAALADLTQNTPKP